MDQRRGTPQAWVTAVRVRVASPNYTSRNYTGRNYASPHYAGPNYT